MTKNVICHPWGGAVRAVLQKNIMSGWMVKEHLDEVVFAVTVTSSSFHLERGRRREIMFVCVCVREREREM